MLSFDAIASNVMKWAFEHGIFAKSTQKDQFTKTVEEVGEIAAAIARGDKDALKDAIGDTAITLIILAQLSDLDLLECINEAWSAIAERKGAMVDGIFVKESEA